jgi:CheY-like chemotaxis protein
VRDYLRALLEQAGYTVFAVGDGRIALAYLKQVRVDAILLDLMMPKMSGWEVVQTLQADPLLKRIPIVVFSAVGDDPVPGATVTLVKPSTPELVLNEVQRVVRGDRRRAPRFPAHFGVATTTSVGALRTFTRDVSAGGLCFESSIAPPVGERMRLTVDLAVHGVVAVDAEVRHVAPVDSGWRIGTQFLTFQQNAVGFVAELQLLARSTAPG